MRVRDLLRIIKKLGGEVVRQRGSHIRIRLGNCYTTIPDHGKEDIKKGTLHGIEADLEPCLGKGWLKKWLQKN
jgi:predicted RNA binding protein YcfA (HicA-like mRNA interferase family)